MPSVVDGDCDAVEHHRKSVSALGSFGNFLKEVAQSHGLGGELTGLAVEVLGGDGDARGIDTPLAEVTLDLLHAEEVGLSLERAVDARPQVVLRPLGGGRAPLKKGGEAVDHGLIADEAVHGALRGGDQVQKSQRLGPLGGLGEAVHAGGAVELAATAIEDTEDGAGQELAVLARASPVGHGVDIVAVTIPHLALGLAEGWVGRWGRETVRPEGRAGADPSRAIRSGARAAGARANGKWLSGAGVVKA